MAGIILLSVTLSLLAGKADIATSAEAVLVSHSFQNKNLRILSTIAIGNTNGVVARKDRGIKTAKDLKGKRVGVTGKSAAMNRITWSQRGRIIVL